MKRIFGLLIAGVILSLAAPAKAEDPAALMKKLLLSQHLDFYVNAMSDHDMRMVIIASCEMLDEGKTPEQVNQYLEYSLKGSRYLVSLAGLFASVEMCPIHAKAVTEWAEKR